VIVETIHLPKSFGSIERVWTAAVWRTDFSKIKAGSIVQATGYLVLNLLDALVERACGRLSTCLKTRNGNSDLRPLLPVYDHGPQA